MDGQRYSMYIVHDLMTLNFVYFHVFSITGYRPMNIEQTDIAVNREGRDYMEFFRT